MIEQVFREYWGRTLASMIGFLGGDFQLAEDPDHRDLAITDGFSTFYHVPRSFDVAK